MNKTKLDLSLELTTEQFSAYEADPSGARLAITQALQRWVEGRSVPERIELVRTITRSKARVWNWDDLEREIFHGAV